MLTNSSELQFHFHYCMQTILNNFANVVTKKWSTFSLSTISLCLGDKYLACKKFWQTFQMSSKRNGIFVEKLMIRIILVVDELRI